MLKQYSLLALQKAINRGLALDESIPAKLKSLEGKSLEIAIQPLSVKFYIVFQEGQIQLRESYDGETDTQIVSSPMGLIRLSLLPASKARSLFNDKIRISGDIELGLKVKQIFEELDIDWEGHLAEFTGDVIAHQLSGFLHKGLSFARNLGQSLSLNTSDYLHEELRLFPNKLELEDLFNAIDTLSHDVERLEASIKQIKAETHDKTR